MLFDYLKKEGFPCVFTREPGGTEIGERVREIILDPDSSRMHKKTELLLYLASRAQHVYEKIMPALKDGFIIIADRYSDSTFAYQGAARDSGINRFRG